MADPQVKDGQIVRGTPLSRLAAGYGDGESETVGVLAGDLRDVCKTLDAKHKAVSPLLARTNPPQVKPGETIDVPAADVKAVIDLAVGK